MHGIQHFYEVAQRTVDALPDPFRASAKEVVLRVVNWPSRDILHDMELHDPLELTGLYEGVPMTHRSFADPAPFPDTVWLFREPILHEWQSRGDIDLDDLITHVTVHEFAHHFGWSDDDIAAIDRWWE